MDKVPLDSHQLAAVEALAEVKRICEEHSIRYYLLAGSVLGAVRHKGIIPWDDDVDIGLLCDDLERFQKVVTKELDPKFKYVDYDTDENWSRLFGKIVFGNLPCLDVFVLAKWTDSRVRGYFHWVITKFARSCFYHVNGYVAEEHKRPGWSNLRYFESLVMGVFRRTIIPIISKALKKDGVIRFAKWNERFFDKKNSHYYINLYSVYSMDKEMIRAEWINNPSEVEFEGQIYTTVGDPDAYLTHLYGDYMTPPPEDQRVRLHTEEI